MAAALGLLDAVNLFDYHWMEPEYDVWYHLLNCGFHLPASTGSDWFICNHNRVYVQLDGGFNHRSWWDGLLAGRTFITNGPVVFLSANGRGPGDTIGVRAGTTLSIKLTWESYRPIHSLDLILDGSVVTHRDFPQGTCRGEADLQCIPGGSGWLAARCSGVKRDSFNQPIFAHTSPIYIDCGKSNGDARQASASFFVRSIDDAVDWITNRGRFDSVEQRDTVRGLFLEAGRVYQSLT